MSPRPGPRQVLVAFRLPEESLEAIDKAAAEAGRDRSEHLRAMLAYARRKMPKGWRP